MDNKFMGIGFGSLVLSALAALLGYHSGKKSCRRKRIYI